MRTRVVIGDDHEVIRQGLKSVLSGSGVEVVAVASTASEIRQQVQAQKPDVVMLDVRLSDDDGIELLSELRKSYPKIPVVMLSTFDNPTYVARSIAHGASDYLLKGSTRDEIVESLQRAAKGEPAPETSVMRQIQTSMERRRDRTVSPDNPLTNRERQVLRHIALGLSNKEIATSLGISVETIKEHVQNILRKLGSPDRTAAAVWAVKMGYLD